MALLPYKDPALSIDARVEDLIARMTLDEKWLSWAECGVARCFGR